MNRSLVCRYVHLTTCVRLSVCLRMESEQSCFTLLSKLSIVIEYFCRFYLSLWLTFIISHWRCRDRGTREGESEEESGGQIFLNVTIFCLNKYTFTYMTVTCNKSCKLANSFIFQLFVQRNLANTSIYSDRHVQKQFIDNEENTYLHSGFPWWGIDSGLELRKWADFQLWKTYKKKSHWTFNLVFGYKRI